MKRCWGGETGECFDKHMEPKLVTREDPPPARLQQKIS